MKIPALIVVALSAVSAPAMASMPTVRQASIDHANNGGIRDWHAPNAKGIYLRDRTNRWYYAAFSHACPGVMYDDTVGFDTFGDHRFDRSSRVVTRLGSCAIDSLTASPPPAAKGGRVKPSQHQMGL